MIILQMRDYSRRHALDGAELLKIGDQTALGRAVPEADQSVCQVPIRLLRVSAFRSQVERVRRSQVGGNGRRAGVVKVDFSRRRLSVQCCERLDDRLFARVQSLRAGTLQVQTDHHLVFNRGPVLLQSLSPQVLPLELDANLVQIGLSGELDVN